MAFRREVSISTVKRTSRIDLTANASNRSGVLKTSPGCSSGNSPVWNTGTAELGRLLCTWFSKRPHLWCKRESVAHKSSREQKRSAHQTLFGVSAWFPFLSSNMPSQHFSSVWPLLSTPPLLNKTIKKKVSLRRRSSSNACALLHLEPPPNQVGQLAAWCPARKTGAD